MIIAFTGAQGTGKTTLLDVLEKCTTLPTTFKFVKNFTRDLAKAGYSINEAGTDDTQLAIMRSHKSYVDSSDYIIMDRCVLDGLVYTTHLYRLGQVSKSTLEKCKSVFEQCISKYDKIYYIRPEFPITGDEYRSDKPNYQSEIADIFEEIIQQYKVPVIQLTGTVGDRLSTIQKTLKYKWSELIC